MSSSSSFSNVSHIHIQPQLQSYFTTTISDGRDSSTNPSSYSSSPVFPISLTPLKGRISPLVATLEMALGAYDDYQGESLVLRIGNIIELIFAIADSFSPDLIPETWKAKFKAIEHLVIPSNLSGIPTIIFKGSAREDLLAFFPRLRPLFYKVKPIPVMGQATGTARTEEKKS